CSFGINLLSKKTVKNGLDHHTLSTACYQRNSQPFENIVCNSKITIIARHLSRLLSNFNYPIEIKEMVSLPKCCLKKQATIATMASNETPSNKDWWSRFEKFCKFLAL